jgi:hypothetical protein
MNGMFLQFLMWVGLFSMPSLDIADKITHAIKAGNASELAQYFGSTVDLSMMGKEDLYSKNQAEQIVKDFFLKHPPKQYHPKNQNASLSASQYGIGTYHDQSGKVFKVYYVLKKMGNQTLIQLFSIEAEIH